MAPGALDFGTKLGNPVIAGLLERRQFGLLGIVVAFEERANGRNERGNKGTRPNGI